MIFLVQVEANPQALTMRIKGEVSKHAPALAFVRKGGGFRV